MVLLSIGFVKAFRTVHTGLARRTGGLTGSLIHFDENLKVIPGIGGVDGDNFKVVLLDPLTDGLGGVSEAASGSRSGC
jgi:hypothetical protein